MKEVFWLHPVVPLLLPRISNVECVLNGYTLPIDTNMFVNVWEHANEFMPKRFKGKDVDWKGQNFELLPFGSGTRVRLGLSMALSVVDVTLANLVNKFDWKLPYAAMPTSISMVEKKGVTTKKATPLTSFPKQRSGGQYQAPPACCIHSASERDLEREIARRKLLW